MDYLESILDEEEPNQDILTGKKDALINALNFIQKNQNEVVEDAKEDQVCVLISDLDVEESLEAIEIADNQTFEELQCHNDFDENQAVLPNTDLHAESRQTNCQPVNLQNDKELMEYYSHGIKLTISSDDQD